MTGAWKVEAAEIHYSAESALQNLAYFRHSGLTAAYLAPLRAASLDKKHHFHVARSFYLNSRLLKFDYEDNHALDDGSGIVSPESFF